jgi:hypothetical protein
MNPNSDKESGARTVSSQDPRAFMKFPALWFSESLVEVVDSLSGLTECTRLGFKSGFYKDLVLIDSNSNKFQVVDAQKVRTVMKFKFRELLGLVTGNPRWQIQLIFAPGTTKISLDELKSLISNSFKKEKYLWEEMSDFEELQEEVLQASSLDQILAIFKKFNVA